MLGCFVCYATGLYLFYTLVCYAGILEICFWSVDASCSVELLGSLLNKESINNVGYWVSY